jgi:hypothetical protein
MLYQTMVSIKRIVAIVAAAYPIPGCQPWRLITIAFEPTVPFSD